MTSCWAVSALCIGLAFSPLTTVAGASSAAFAVRLSLADSAGFCGVGAGGQVVKVACNQGSYNFMAYLIQNQLVVDAEQSLGFGATTAYRVVAVNDLRYIEMTVGW